MKKDFTRDYATSAFRMWAREGCPTYAEAVARIKKRVLLRAGNAAPDVVLVRVDAEIDKRSALLCDILACEETFAALDKSKKYISDAVRAVYMAEPYREPKRNEITSRVVRYSIKAHISEPQIYRYLRYARELFCGFRGLRITDDVE